MERDGERCAALWKEHGLEMKFGSGLEKLEQMRVEWNGRAKEDAHFYVAFGQRNQTEADFLASSAHVMPMFEQEFSRLPRVAPVHWRALEIGCGPGRLLLPMARHFGAVDGVDISEEMVALARERLRRVPNAKVHQTSGADLSMFSDCSFDFVYSYVVFQHIPDQKIVLNYLREAQRVLKAGGVLCCQIRGKAPLPSELMRESATWTGCFFSAEDIAEFSRAQCFPLVALSGPNTQYMWTTFRKSLNNAGSYAADRIIVKDVTAAGGPGSTIPNRGSGSAVSLWIAGMPEWAGLADLPVWFGNRHQLGCYLSPISEAGGCQLNAQLPEGMKPGEYVVELKAGTELSHGAHSITVVAAPAASPRVLSVTDGINVTSRSRLQTGSAEIIIEDVPDPEEFSFRVADRPLGYLQNVCIDPISWTYSFSGRLDGNTPLGMTRFAVYRAGVEIDSINVEVLQWR